MDREMDPNDDRRRPQEDSEDGRDYDLPPFDLSDLGGDFPEDAGRGPESAIADADLTPEQEAQVRAAMEALLSDPFPQRPFALVPKGGERTPEYTDYIIHKDVETEHQCVFIFDSIVDAFAVAEEYKQATGSEAEAIEIDVYSLDEDRFWVKFYRSNGVVAILSLPEYRRHMGLARDY